jgi:hypothetical protein
VAMVDVQAEPGVVAVLAASRVVVAPVVVG